MKKRNTIQSRLVLDAVKELANHPTADDVYNKVNKMHPSISRGTVYRNLNSLSETGNLLKISVPDAADRFDHTLGDHYHIKCVDCGEFIDVELEYAKKLDNEIAKLTGYDVFKHEIVFKGICEECRNDN